LTHRDVEALLEAEDVDIEADRSVLIGDWDSYGPDLVDLNDGLWGGHLLPPFSFVVVPFISTIRDYLVTCQRVNGRRLA